MTERERQFTIGGASILLAILLGWLSWSAQSAYAAHETAKLREIHALNVLLTNDAVLRAAHDAETGLRGFLLTRDTAFLEAFERGKHNLPLSLQQLRTLTRDNPTQHMATTRLEHLAMERMQQMERSLLLGKQEPFDPDKLLVFMRADKETMDALQAEVSRLENDERRHLAQHQLQAARAKAHADQWNMALVAFSLVLCAICVFAIIATFRARRESRKQRLMAQNHLALAEGRHLLQAIIDSSNDAIFVKDKQGKVLFVNKRFQQIVQRPLSELHGLPLPPAIDPQEAKLLAEADRAVMTTGEPQVVEEHLEVDGVSCIFRTDKIPWLRDRNVEGVIGISRDVTKSKIREAELEERVAQRTEELEATLKTLQREMAERESAEQTVRQMQRMESLGQMTGGIAHDFNNMLSIIIGSLEIARQHIPDGTAPRLATAISNAEEGASRAATLTSRLLTFARQQPLDPSPVAVNSLIRKTAELLVRTLGGTIQLELDLDPDAGWIEIDAPQLEGVLINLCVNARDAMPDGGRLILATERQGPKVAICVIDSGEGMPPDVISRAFEPFFTTKEIGKGTGLGLSQVHGFVIQSGGTVEIASQPGEGTTVSLLLPAIAPPATQPDQKTCDLTVTAQGEVVLLVEDEPLVRKIAEEALTLLGYSVIATANGKQALAELNKRNDIALMLTDISMPGMNGKALAETARKAVPSLKVLLTTGFDPHASNVKGLPVLMKPYLLEELAAAVHQALAA